MAVRRAAKALLLGQGLSPRLVRSRIWGEEYSWNEMVAMVGEGRGRLMLDRAVRIPEARAAVTSPEYTLPAWED